MQRVRAKRSLKERREMLGLTQAQLAHRAVGLGAHDVSMAETGRDDKGWRTPKVRRVLIEAELWKRKCRHENTRIARQRAVWEGLPDGPAKDRLIELLSDAAWQMLDGGHTEEADMVLSILPEAVATKLLDDFFGEC